MKRMKLLFGTALLASGVALASCSISLDETTSSKEVETSTSSTKTLVTTTAKEEDKYEILTPLYQFWLDSINQRWIKYAIPVKNTGNTDLYLGSMSMDIESKDGKLLQTESYISGYPEYIKPGEIGYYYDESTVDFSDEEVNLLPHSGIEHASNSVIRYDVSDISIEEDDLYGVKVLGRVENNTDEVGSTVKIAALLFDSNDNLICSCYTYLDDDLAVNDKVGFTARPFSYRSFTPSDVASFKIYAYPTQFNFNW